MKKLLIVIVIVLAVAALAGCKKCLRSHKEWRHDDQKTQLECFQYPGLPYMGGKNCTMIVRTYPARDYEVDVCDLYEEK